VLRKAELQRLLNHVSHTRHPERDRVMVLLTFKAGLRAKEVASLTWSMVTDTTGELADAISLPNRASKGKNGGRTIVYQRDVVGPGSIDTLYWSYPASQKAQWDSAVTLTALTFQPGNVTTVH